MKGITRRARACAVAAAAGAVALAGAASAQAQRPASVGDGVPTGQMGVQMFNYGSYISNGSSTGTPNPITSVSTACLTSTTTACRRERLEALFAFLQRKGLTNIELFSHATFPAQNDIPGLIEYRQLLDKYGLHAGGWHGTVTDVGPAWTERVAAAKILGADFIGSGGTASPGVGTYQNTLLTAQALNRLGKESVEAGVGPVYIHNHTGEFDARYVDDGVLKSAWQILMDRTDPRYVAAEIDVFWAQDAFNDVTGTASATLINGNPTRVQLLHMKDGINVEGQPAPDNSRSGSPRAFGTGEIDFRPVLTAAKNRVRYYHQEHDGGTIADADVSFTNLKGVGPAVVGTVLGLPPTFPSVAAGTPAAENAVSVTLQNTGDAPLTITGLSIGSDTGDAGDFSIVSQTCTTAGALAPGQLLATPPVPRGACTVRIGFKPTRTNYRSVARLQITSNSDDATERVLLTAQSTADVIGTVGGDVASTLALSLGSGTASFGSFLPATARTYDTAIGASVVSTAGSATLSVTDPSGTATGRLVNGTFSLPTPLQVRAANAANPSPAYASLSTTAGTPVELLGLSTPTAGAEDVTIGLRQSIGASDMLRTGRYSKSLTFTLSTTTP